MRFIWRLSVALMCAFATANHTAWAQPFPITPETITSETIAPDQSAAAKAEAAADARKLFFDSLNVDIYNSRPGTSDRFDCPTPVKREESSSATTQASGPLPTAANQEPRDTASNSIKVCLANEFAYTTVDLERNDEARSFTSEALFAQSAQRLNRPLTKAELRSIARGKEEFRIEEPFHIYNWERFVRRFFLS